MDIKYYKKKCIKYMKKISINKLDYFLYIKLNKRIK